MARGNIYILLHPDDLNDEPPQKTKVRYTWEENIFDDSCSFDLSVAPSVSCLPF